VPETGGRSARAAAPDGAIIITRSFSPVSWLPSFAAPFGLPSHLCFFLSDVAFRCLEEAGYQTPAASGSRSPVFS